MRLTGQAGGTRHHRWDVHNGILMGAGSVQGGDTAGAGVLLSVTWEHAKGGGAGTQRLNKLNVFMCVYSRLVKCAWLHMFVFVFLLSFGEGCIAMGVCLRAGLCVCVCMCEVGARVRGEVCPAAAYL